MFETLTTMFELITQYWSYFARGVGNTLLLSFAAVIGGSAFGAVIYAIRASSIKPISFIGKAYIDIFRGTPMIVQVWIAFLQLPKIIPFPDGVFMGMALERTLPVLLALILNSAAYVAEIIRAGVEAVDKGQMEAARSVGMPKLMAMKEIIMPQAIKNVIPAICNEFVTLIKETAVIHLVGVGDLMYNMNAVKSQTYQILPNYYIVGILYFIINFFASRAVSLIERKMKKA